MFKFYNQVDRHLFICVLKTSTDNIKNAIMINHSMIFICLLFCDIGSPEILKDQNEISSVWNLPDASVSIGYLFYYELPRENMDRRITRYKAFLDRDKLLPAWLNFNETAGYFEGVPASEDLGESYITVEAYGKNVHDFINNEFTVEVLAGNQVYDTSVKDTCMSNEEKTVVIIVLEADFSTLSYKERVKLIKKCAETLEVSPLIIKISEQEHNDDILSDAVLAAGPGNAKRLLRNHNSSVVLHWQVGCSGNLWADSIDKLDRVKIITKNGTMSKNLGFPVIGWRLVKEDIKRPRREIISEEVHNSAQEYSVPERAVAVDSATPVFGPELSPTMPAPTSVHLITTSVAVLSTIHHHRHNHGYSSSLHSVMPSSSEYLLSSQVSSDAIAPTSHRVLRSYDSSDYDKFNHVNMESLYSSEVSSEFISRTELSPSMTPVSPPPSARVTEERGMTEADEEEIIHEEVPEGATPPIPEDDQENFIDSGVPSESYNPDILSGGNQSPEIRNRIQKLRFTAGKVFRHPVPEDAFFDREDGGSKNLSLKFLSAEKGPIFDNSWIQFNEKTQEIYGLPLDDQVSQWNFVLSATDSSGLSVEDTIFISVQHHKGRRTVTHAIDIEVTAVPKGPQVDWELSLLQSIRTVLKDFNESSVIVLAVNTTGLPYIFSITNDSLPKNPCPQEEIETAVKELNSKLNHIVDRTIRIGSIKWIGKGHCEPRKPHGSDISNEPPSKRNQVDHLNATVGQLLLYTVPEDTFYDKEDAHTRNLHLSLLTLEMKSVKKTNWLQFDEKNQEFYGIPMASNVGQAEYLLLCEDRGGLSITDSLVVTVLPAPQTLYNVEFSMKLDIDYQSFIESPPMQRSFIERLATLFGDKNTNNIVLSGLSPGSTVVTWHNKSLPTNICPDNHILSLRQIMLGDDEKITPAVGIALGPEFPVINAKLTPTGLCQGSLTSIIIEPNGGNTTDVTAVSHGEQYLIGLVIPTIVIAVMLLCAGFVACILYRRRRTGKMTVGDEDERQSFRSKGIPVIFQDELDERPEQSNKSPVIMKEEKPPLPPPEYQRGPPLATTALLSDTEDTPYQPPPPFTSSRDSARPKPTPTYRMPPPYVPP